VGDAGVAEQVPVVALDRALIADRERGEDTGDATLRDVRVDRVANALAQPLDRMAGARVEQHRGRVADVAGGANALLEQRQLVVEAVRIEVAVRLAQANGEAPALAGTQREARLHQRRVLVEARVPAEGDDARDAVRRAAGVDFEAKAQPARPLLRQVRDDTGDDDVAALDPGRQRFHEPQRRLRSGQREAGSERCGDHDQAAHRARARRRDDDRRGRDGERGNRHVDVEAPEIALLKLQGNAGEPCQRQRHQPSAAAGCCHRGSVGFGLDLAVKRTMSSIYDRLTDLDISLPPLAIPAGAYVPFVRTGNLVFISGHIAKRDGKVWVGQLGRDMTTATGKKAARAVAIDLLGTLHAAVGDLDKVERIVRITSLVNSAPDFIEHHLVTNGCSELFGEVFADKGAHARSAYGVAQLPLGACVEIELIAQAAE